MRERHIAADRGGVVGHAVESEPREGELVGGALGPPEEAIGDHEAEAWTEREKGLLEVGLHELGGGGEGGEEGQGREVLSALDAGGEAGDVGGEREGDHGGGGVGEGGLDEGAVGGGGEEGDGEAAAEEEAGQVEEWDGVAF